MGNKIDNFIDAIYFNGKYVIEVVIYYTKSVYYLLKEQYAWWRFKGACKEYNKKLDKNKEYLSDCEYDAIMKDLDNL
jgi:hypothetical protein